MKQFSVSEIIETLDAEQREARFGRTIFEKFSKSQPPVALFQIQVSPDLIEWMDSEGGSLSASELQRVSRSPLAPVKIFTSKS